MWKKSLLEKILAVLARSTIRKYKPLIIGVTGSVGKTSARLAIYAVLKKKYEVSTAEKNYNNEIGLPLTILGLPHYGKNILGWLYGLIRANKRIVWRGRYPEMLVLEYGMDRPGDMEYLLGIARPTIGVVTAIGEVPAHVEFFKDAAEVAREKAKLVEALPAEGYAILNHDDHAVSAMKEKTEAQTITFGLEPHSDVRIILTDISVSDQDRMRAGVSFNLEYEGNVVPVRLDGVLGLPQAYAVAAAAATGAALAINLVQIFEALGAYTPPPGRMRILEGKNNSRIIDDTYNASPESMRSALSTLERLAAKRKIAVLGDMLEIGRFGKKEHWAIGERSAGFLDLLFCVGPLAKFIGDGARQAGLPVRKIFTFEDSFSAGAALSPVLEEGDWVLAKGSQAIRMERAVAEIMARSDLAPELLVRQERHWV